VAIHDGSRLLAEHTWLANQAHTRSLLPSIVEVLESSGLGMSDVTAIAVALGPGSFNGLRVGLSTAKGLAIALGQPLVGASSLELIAAEYDLDEPTMNAGRGRVYSWRRETPAAEIELRTGSAPDRIRHAGVLASLGWDRLRAGQTLDPARIQPLYVQEPEITESRKAQVRAA
jgi:tRNA A37 threonylcarbamoyladenosine modification protein TsaB